MESPVQAEDAMKALGQALSLSGSGAAEDARETCLVRGHLFPLLRVAVAEIAQGGTQARNAQKVLEDWVAAAAEPASATWELSLPRWVLHWATNVDAGNQALPCACPLCRSNGSKTGASNPPTPHALHALRAVLAAAQAAATWQPGAIDGESAEAFHQRRAAAIVHAAAVYNGAKAPPFGPRWVDQDPIAILRDLKGNSSCGNWTLGPVRDLLDYLLKPPAEGDESALWPEVEPSAAVAVPFSDGEDGVGARLAMERVGGDFGECYPHPASLFFLRWDKDYEEAIRQAVTCVRPNASSENGTADVRWHFRRFGRKETELWREHRVAGESHGVAFGIGLRCLLLAQPRPDPFCLVTGTLDRGGYVGSVSGYDYKLGVLDRCKEARLVAPAADSATIATSHADYRNRVEGASTLEEAHEKAAGDIGRYLQRRTDDLRAHSLLYTPLAGFAAERVSAAELTQKLNMWLTLGRLGEAQREQELQRERLDDVRQLLERRGSFVIVGAPGGGKTVTLEEIERLALRDHQEQEGRSPRLPVFLPLARWELAVGQSREALKGFVCAQARELEPVFDAYLDAGRFLFLFDALNEMPEYHADSRQVALLRQWIEEYGEAEADGSDRSDRSNRSDGSPQQPKCRFFFSCRTENYQTSLPARRVDVSPLDDEGIEEMSRRYLAACGREPDRPAFLGNLRTLEVWDLCHNPMQLSMFLALRVENRPTPRNVGELFRAMRDLLFEREAAKPGGNGIPRDTMEAALKSLGFSVLDKRLQSNPNRDGDGAAAGGLTDLSRVDAERMMSPALGGSAGALPSPGPDAVLAAARDLQFLEIIGVDRDFPTYDRIRFTHHRWQELWAALQIAREHTPAGTPFTDADWRRFLVRFWFESEMPNRQQSGVGSWDPLPPPPPTGWEEVLLLLAGFHPRPDDFVRSLLPVNPVMAARCIHEGRAQVEETVRREAIQGLLEIIQDTEHDLALRVRIAAGDALGHLLDWPRRWDDPSLTDPIMPEMIELPGSDSFLMGSTDKDRKRYEHRLGEEFRDYGDKHARGDGVALNAFRIGKYPVTVREYARFVNDRGYENPEWWTAAGREWLDGGTEDDPRTQPDYWNDPRLRQPNRPLVHVKWYEAVAYCNWLTDKLRSVAPRGRYRLPTEAEWEYAARGEGRRLWPWGDDPPLIAENVATRCNAWIGDNYAASTTPVGIYPLGRTPEGIDELAGNVWEWCSSLYQSYPYSANDGRENLEAKGSRVLRGGSWGDGDPGGFRCAARSGGGPSDRGRRGFRLARTLTP